LKNTIFIKIFVPFMALTIALTGLILAYSYTLFQENYIETERENLFHIADLLHSEVKKDIISGRIDRRDLKEWVKKTGVRITIIDKNGFVLADSERDASTMENHKERPEIEHTLKHGRGHSIRYSSTVHADMLYTAILLGSVDNPIGTLRVSHYLEKTKSLTEALLSTLLKVTGATLLVALLIMYFVTRQITRPVRDLKEAVSKIQEGKFDVDFPIIGNDEIADLASHFQTMSKKVNYLFQNLTKQKEELTRIIDSIGDGLIVLSEDGKIIHTNRKFEFMVGKNIVQQMFFANEITIETLNTYLKRVIESRIELQEELEIRGKTILAVSGFIYPIKEFVVVLHDITDLKNLEQIKKDLIANVSHELRTPLTAIKGYLETIEEDIPEDYSKYITILQRHTERMINIVQDLLILSELETEKRVEFSEGVNLCELINDVINVLGGKARNKELYLNIEKPDAEKILIQGDSFRLEQAFINLVENAIKYTESGGVTITIKKDNSEAKVTISDTGSGMEEKHIPRVFERFYVVDKSRSRKLGGSGLGLSIVKHIIQLHRGRIQVESQLNQGTTFTLFFKLKNNR